MKRTLLSTLVITSTLGLSANVFALSMGELELKSTLNQPLQAEITLTNVDDLSEWEIKPSLASDGDFDRAGVEKIFFLSDIDFEIQGNRIVLTSDKSVTEPFLNFLVQVNWPSGRVLREYTLLLDPPVFDEQIQPLAAEQEAQRVETQAVVPVVAPTANPWQTEAAAPGTYKVQKDDTLWEIAINTRPSRKVSPQQMMLAIQDSNPGAFIKGNINRLKTHQVLRIPTEQQMAARNNSQAVNEVLRQNRELKTAGAQLDATAKAPQTNKAEQLVDGGELKLLAKESEVSESAGASGEVGLKGEGNQEGLQNDLAIALETLDTNKLENDELKTRLAALEDQIATLQRLVSLKDDQLASIQTIELQKNAQLAEVTEDVIAETDLVAQVNELPESLEVEAASAPESLEGEVTGELGTETDFNYVEPTEEIVESKPVEVPTETLATDAAIDPVLAADQIQQQIEDRYKPKGFVAEVMAKPEMLAGIVGGFALLLGLIGLAWKKRRDSKEEIEDPDLVGFDENFEFTDDTLDDASLDGFEFDENDAAIAENELNDDLLEGIGAEDDSDIDIEDSADTVAQTADIIGEAEIYIAYGRFDQAADLLKNSIQQEPSRLDLRMKLLEVYVETDDAESFAEAELDLNAIGDTESNEKALAMRSRLTAPINGTDETPVIGSSDLMSEHAPEMGIEGLADAGDEFADGIDFEAALDFSDEEVSLEGEDFSASLDALDDLTSESEPELDLGGDLDFDLSEPEIDSVPTLDEIPQLDELSELDEVPELEVLADLEELSDLDDLSDSEALSGLDEVPTLDDLDDFSDLDELSEASESNEMPTLDELSFDEDDLDLGDELTELSENSVVELSPVQSSSDDLSDLESLLDSEDIIDADSGLPDLSFDLEDTGFAEGDSLTEDIPSLDDELETLPVETLTEEFSEEGTSLDIDEPVLASEFDLDELEDLPDFTAETAAADVESGADQEIDLEQLAASDNEFDFLAGTDECATKLDLARAYLDMEDLDGAKELLQEVVSEGNDQQRNDARSLLENIS
jgi:pilus assembly protein FimV